MMDMIFFSLFSRSTLRESILRLFFLYKESGAVFVLFNWMFCMKSVEGFSIKDGL